MKFKKILLLVAAFVFGFLLYLVLFSKNNETKKVLVERREPVKLVKTSVTYSAGDNKQTKLTMKQIDSMTANLNYKFTISNRVNDSVSAASNVDIKKAEWKEKK